MESNEPRAIVLGGTGAMGVAIAELFVQRGWAVEVTGRNRAGMPAHLTEQGVRFHALDRGDVRGMARLLGQGANLVVDLAAYRAADAEGLFPLLADVDSTVIASSRAVYIDAEGHHVNSDSPPRFAVPLREDNPTLEPAAPDVSPFSREGYAPSKVALERLALGSGLPITILRPSKVHGPWARNARTRGMVERMVSGAPFIELADRGASIDHLSAAANIAKLVLLAAEVPGSRIVNAADPDPLQALQIVESIAEAVQWKGEIRLLEPGARGGEHPWYQQHRIILDMEAAVSLGYRPAAPGRELIQSEAAWVASSLGGKLKSGFAG